MKRALVSLVVIAVAACPPVASSLKPDDLEATCEACNTAYEAGKTSAAASTPVASDSTLYDDLTEPFNPWRIFKARPPVDAVGDGARMPASMQESFKTWAHGEGLTSQYKNSNLPSFTVKSLTCKFDLKKGGEPTIRSPWEQSASGTACEGLQEQEGVWWYIGMLAGWLDQQPEKIKEYYKQQHLKIDLTYSKAVAPGQRQRGGAWHIDGEFSTAQEPQNIYGSTKLVVTGSCAPLYFVTTSKYPTVFFKKNPRDFISDAAMQQLVAAADADVDAPVVDATTGAVEGFRNGLKRHGCKQDTAPSSDSPCAARQFLDDVLGTTYQPEVVKDHLNGNKHLYQTSELCQEPPLQYVKGYWNRHVMDAATRHPGLYFDMAGDEVTNPGFAQGVDPMQPIESKHNLEITCGDTASGAKKSWNVGKDDNPMGTNFRTAIPEGKRADAIFDSDSADGYGLAVMGPYRLHLAGIYPKNSESDTSEDRFFLRFSLVPYKGECTLSAEDEGDDGGGVGMNFASRGDSTVSPAANAVTDTLDRVNRALERELSLLRGNVKKQPASDNLRFAGDGGNTCSDEMGPVPPGKEGCPETCACGCFANALPEAAVLAKLPTEVKAALGTRGDQPLECYDTSGG